MTRDPATQPRIRTAPANPRRALALWQLAAVAVVTLIASLLHFAYELSGFWTPMAQFGSVNESTYEHLKIFFWGGLIFALIQHAYVKEYANNYWAAKAVALAVTPLGIIVSFYFYLGIVLPIWGRGTLALDIGTGVFGVVLGEWLAYRIMVSPQRGSTSKRRGLAAIAIMTVLAISLTWLPPRMFLFENFYGYEYSGDYGILDDYTPYLVFEPE